MRVMSFQLLLIFRFCCYASNNASALNLGRLFAFFLYCIQFKCSAKQMLLSHCCLTVFKILFNDSVGLTFLISSVWCYSADSWQYLRWIQLHLTESTKGQPPPDIG